MGWMGRTPCAMATMMALVWLLPAGAQQPDEKPKPATVTGQVEMRTKTNKVIRSFKSLVVYLKPTGKQTLPTPPLVEVRQKGARFGPPLLVIARGQTVRFVNDDDIFHNVFSYSRARKFDLGLYKSGKYKDIKFDKPGLIKIHCSIHESMNGTIFVADSPYHAVIKKGNRFTLPKVRHGSYELLTWHKRFPKGKATLKLVPGETARVTLQLGASNAQ